MEHLEILGRRIKHFRKLNDVTQKELAEKLGVAKGYIANIEQGNRKPSFDMLIEICNFFGVGMADLFPPKTGATEKDMLIREVSDTLREWESGQIKLLKTMVVR